MLYGEVGYFDFTIPYSSLYRGTSLYKLKKSNRVRKFVYGAAKDGALHYKE